MYLPKGKGGCGIIDIYCKSKSILFNTFLKIVLDEGQLDFKLMIYYCQVRASYLIESYGFRECSVFTPPFYFEAIDILRVVVKLNKFPSVTAKTVYWTLIGLEKFQSRIEQNYPLFDWKVIWGNVFNKYIDIDSRVILYKYVHEILMTNDRLYMMKIASENKCLNCGELDTNMHLMYFCPLAKNLINWFKTLFHKLCNVKTKNFIKILKLDFDPYTIKDKNTAVILIAEYITGVWYGRKIGLLVDDPRLVLFIKSRIIKNRYVLDKMLRESINCMFTKEYIKMD